jgi:hypothetical protein
MVRLVISTFGIHRIHRSPTSPCIFMGHLIPGEPPIYVGIYVNDIIYFSQSDAIERSFESKLSTLGNVDFMGQVSHFLGIEFTWQYLSDGHLAVSVTQQFFIDTFLTSLNIAVEGISMYTTPYKSGSSIDSIPFQDMTSVDRDQLRLKYQSIVRSLNWLAHTTHPDLSTVVSLLAQHQSYLHLVI